MGFIMPAMGMKNNSKQGRGAPTSGLADALFPRVQQRVLGVLFGNPARSFHTNEIIRAAGSGSGAVQRVLARLESFALVTVTRVGRQKHYQADAESPLFEELRGLALKTFGLADVLRAALVPVSDQIRAAFVYGSIAKGQDTAESDIDLMIISDHLTYSDLFEVLEEASAKLGRRVAPTIYSARELQKLVETKNAFVTRVLSHPKLWLIGDVHALSA